MANKIKKADVMQVYDGIPNARISKRNGTHSFARRHLQEAKRRHGRSAAWHVDDKAVARVVRIINRAKQRGGDNRYACAVSRGRFYIAYFAE